MTRTAHSTTVHKGHVPKKAGKIVLSVFALLAIVALYVGVLVFFIVKAIQSKREIANAKAAGTPLDPSKAPNSEGYIVGATVWGIIFGFITVIVSGYFFITAWDVARNNR